MAKGGSKIRRYGGGGGVDPSNIDNTGDLVSERGAKTREVDAVLTVSRSLYEQYGESIGQFILADVKGKDSNTMAYYDGANIGFNRSFFNSRSMDGAYDSCVAQGFHPSRGNRSAMEAVAAHEFGHALTDAVGRKLGVSGIDNASDQIVKEAVKNTSHRGVVQMASRISTYATASNAEAIAEAVSDVYCNGRRARSESRAIVDVINKYLK